MEEEYREKFGLFEDKKFKCYKCGKSYCNDSDAEWCCKKAPWER